MRGSNVTGQQQQREQQQRAAAAAGSSSSGEQQQQAAAAAGERTSEHSARAGTKERESLSSLFSLLSCFEEAAGQGSDSIGRLQAAQQAQPGGSGAEQLMQLAQNTNNNID